MAHVLGVKSPIWNQTMASYIENYANTKAVDCEFDHFIEQYGKNIYKGWNKSSELNACLGEAIL